MHLFVNALSASAGGGLTYVRNVIPELARRPGLRVTVALTPSVGEGFRRCNGIELVELKLSAMRRFCYEQFSLAHVIRGSSADVLLSAGNFALRRSPVPQILLSRNSLYTSRDFYRDLQRRRDYRNWLETRVRGEFARKSIAWADITVAPSEAFAAELREWTDSDRVAAIHHGFDHEGFVRDDSPLDTGVHQKLCLAESSVKLLFVSHYNYYRNFETLIRALPLIRERLSPRTVKLLLTCKLDSGANPGSYRAESTAQLVRELGATEMVIELGTIPYRQLHQIYRSADLYVTPAYAESFAHPLVEAMSSGVPIVASDLPVHKEICGDAAVYFPRFSERELADQVARLASSRDERLRLSQQGSAQAQRFSWRRHVDELLDLACAQLEGRGATALATLTSGAES
jgi:glycosyltransferase involved in cell wall biosynthesis